MKITFLVELDNEIPSQIINEAGELFLNHLRKHCEAQLYLSANPLVSFESLQQTNNVQISFAQSLRILGRSCPVYYKKQRGRYSALKDSLSLSPNIL